MEEGTVAKVINDFLTINEGELNLKKGDIVQVIKIQDMHWCYGSSSRKEGLIPTNYLMELEVPVLDDNQELFASLASFNAQQAGDLSFEKGEIIIGLSPEDDNWWKGKIGDRVGVFPTTYVWRLNSDKFKRRSLNKPLSLKARVTTSMKAQLDEEMDLNEGDIITIIAVVDKTWYRGVCGDRQGIFPKDFVTILNEDDGKLWEQNSPLSTFSLPFDSCASNLAEFSAPPPEETFSRKEQKNSLISFSPEEPKKMSSSPFSSNNFDSLTDEQSSIFPSTENDYFMQESGASEMYGGHMDNLGISPYGITLYPFYGQFDNELSFHEGEIVTLLRHIDDDWIEGEIEGKKGILPVSYVNIVIDCEYAVSEISKTNTSRSNFTHSLRQNTSAKVMHNFHAQMNGDISVTEGEVVFITELVNADWCRVRNDAGTIGLCPSNYLSPDNASEEFDNVCFNQNSLPNDGLPNYTDIFKGQEHHNVNLTKSQKVTESGSNLQQLLSNQRPKSIDDLIAKNIASLDFNWIPPNKTPGDEEVKSEPPYSLEYGSSLHRQNYLSNTPTGVVIESNQNSITSKPKPLSGRLSLPTHLVSTNASPVCGAVPPNERPKRHSELRTADGEHLKKPSQELPNEDVVFRRQGSDRVPHRPAPPIPVPGQKPVRRTLKRNNLLSNKASNSKPNPERTNSISESRQEDHSDESTACGSIEQRVKDSERRQNVISELVITEKEYVRDLKLTYETFHLHNEEFLESRGIDVKTIFGNIIEVMHLSENLLDKILFSMKNKDDDDQIVGPCFLEFADEMKTVYNCYCMNHDTAITLLEKYENNENIQRIFNKGIETLKYQVACFDMGSILIKPVQRILKYPLILNELIKCTDDTHKDKPLLLEAVKKMTEVASHINEFKRRKDLVSKYLDDGNDTLSNRMSKLSLHSVLKKSSRLGMKLSSSLGIGLTAKDPEFDVHELLFRALEKSIKTFVRNIELFYAGLEEVILCQSVCGEILNNCFKESKYSGVVEFKDTQNIILTKYLVEFKTVIDSRVLKPLNILIDLFEGPDKLIQKRNDKLLDYNRSLAKSEKNRESRLSHDEILLSKNNYDALNSQLLEELPKLIVIAYEIFLECIAAFISARKLFSGRATKQYLSLCENSLMLSQGNVLEVFSVKHSLVSNQIGRFGFVTKKFSCEPGDKTDENKSPILRTKQKVGTEQISQYNSQQVYLQSRYPPEKLFLVKESYVPADTLDLPVNSGSIVAVIKNQDPMGNNKRWFVDAGGTQGFLPSLILEPMYNSNTHSGEDRNRSIESMSIGHSTGAASLLSESADKSSRLRAKRDSAAMFDNNYAPPPAYEEIVESNYGDSHASPPSQSDSGDQRYEEPWEESSFSSHVYAEIPEDSSSTTNEFYFALYDFGGSGPHTLPITSGQVLKVKNFQDLLGNPEWWLVEDRSGKSGYVPGNYLKIFT